MTVHHRLGLADRKLYVAQKTMEEYERGQWVVAGIVEIGRGGPMRRAGRRVCDLQVFGNLVSVPIGKGERDDVCGERRGPRTKELGRKKKDGMDR